MQDANNRGSYGGGEGIQESVPSAQLFCKSKTVLKNHIYYLKKQNKWLTVVPLGKGGERR